MNEILQGKKFKCAFCGGTGVQPRSLKSRCLSCRGKGEVEFEGPVITCSSCKGKGRSPGALGLACIRCKGVGVTEKGETIDALGERLGEITKRFSWMRKETEKKEKEIEKRLKPIKPFVKAALKGRASPNTIGRELKKESIWLKKLGNKIKKEWEFLWKG